MMTCRACAGECVEYKLLHVQGFILGKVTTLASLLTFFAGLDFTDDPKYMPEQICTQCMQKLARACAFKQMVQEVDQYFRGTKQQETQGSNVWAEEIDKQTVQVDDDGSDEFFSSESGEIVQMIQFNENNEAQSNVKNDQVDAILDETIEMMLNEVVETVEICQDIECSNMQDEEDVEEEIVVAGETLEEDAQTAYKIEIVKTVVEEGNRECEGTDTETEIQELEIGEELDCASTDEDTLKGDEQYYELLRDEDDDEASRIDMNLLEDLRQRNNTPVNLIQAEKFNIERDVDALKKIKGEAKDNETKENAELNEDLKNGLKCEVCGKLFKSLKTYKGHMKRHDPFNPKSCEFCGKTYRESETLQKHLLSHTGEKPLICDMCGRAFRFQSNLVAHMRQHTGEKPFKCEKCGRCFGTKRHLVRHEAVHSDARPYVCDLCDKSFAQLRYLELHKFRHTGIKPVQCHICGKSLSRTSELKKHFLTHTGEKPYKCDICGQNYRDQTNLRVHRRQHTGERPYECPYCTKTYYTSTQLKAHTMLHTGERPHACEVCGKGYRALRSLQRHMVTHTGEKQFRCEICGFEFRYESNLISHRRLHNREEVHCQQCEKVFRTEKLLTRHMMMRHSAREGGAAAVAAQKRKARLNKQRNNRSAKETTQAQMPDVVDQKVSKSNIVELY